MRKGRLGTREMGTSSASMCTIHSMYSTHVMPWWMLVWPRVHGRPGGMGIKDTVGPIWHAEKDMGPPGPVGGGGQMGIRLLCRAKLCPNIVAWPVRVLKTTPFELWERGAGVVPGHNRQTDAPLDAAGGRPARGRCARCARSVRRGRCVHFALSVCQAGDARAGR
jgi:hypothetical protein